MPLFNKKIPMHICTYKFLNSKQDQILVEFSGNLQFNLCYKSRGNSRCNETVFAALVIALV